MSNPLMKNEKTSTSRPCFVRSARTEIWFLAALRVMTPPLLPHDKIGNESVPARMQYFLYLGDNGDPATTCLRWPSNSSSRTGRFPHRSSMAEKQILDVAI